MSTYMNYDIYIYEYDISSYFKKIEKINNL